MAGPVQVQITHCCNCYANHDGINDWCRSCGSKDVNYQFAHRCEICGRDFDHDDRAEEHIDEHIIEALLDVADGLRAAGDSKTFSEMFGAEDLSFDIGTLDPENSERSSRSTASEVDGSPQRFERLGTSLLPNPKESRPHHAEDDDRTGDAGLQRRGVRPELCDGEAVR